MKLILQQIFGFYTVSQVVTPVYNPEGILIDAVVTGSSFDFEYIAGVLLFAICLYSFFKLLGAVLKR